MGMRFSHNNIFKVMKNSSGSSEEPEFDYFYGFPHEELNEEQLLVLKKYKV